MQRVLQPAYRASFLSLKWKVLAALSVALVAANASLAYFAYAKAAGQFQSQQISKRLSQVREFQLLASNAFGSIPMFASLIPILGVAGEKQAAASGIGRIDAILSEHWAMLDQEWGIEGLHLFTEYPRVEAIVSWPRTRAAPALDDLLERAAERGRPVTRLVCETFCVQVVVVPLLRRGRAVGLLVVERSVDDTLQEFRLLYDADIALLKAPGSATTVDSDQTAPWRSDVVSVTQSSTTLTLLKAVARHRSLEDLAGQSLRVRHGAEWFEVFAVPPMPTTEGLWVLVINRVTPQIDALQEVLVDSLLLGLAGLLFAELLLLSLLWGPMRRIQEVAGLLPMLVDKSCSRLQQQLAVVAGGRFVRDEVDAMVDMIGSVAWQIERLGRAKASAAQSLRESERNLRLAQSLARVASWTGCPADGTFEIDRGGDHINGILQHLRTWNELITLVHPEDKVALLTAWRAGRLGEGMDIEFRLLIGEKEIALHAVAEFYAPSRGGRMRAIGMIQDISDRHAFERALSDHRDRLEVEVRQRTSELVVARKRAESLAQAKGQFLANMSHEIRTPLSAVLGLSRIGLATDCDPDIRSLFTQIFDAGDHLLRVVNDILDLSKLEAGKPTIEARPFDLRKVLMQCTAMLRQRAENKGLDLRLAIAPNVPQRLVGDAFRLRQILLNLLSNAVKFTCRGSVQLTVSCEARTCCFAVVDSGIGISADDLGRLFTRYHQVVGAACDGSEGTGLGLAISRALATAMGGEIRLSSTPGAGSEFQLRLPMDTDTCTDTAVQSAQALDAKPLSGLRILIADDTPINRTILEALLAAKGAQVEAVVDGSEVLRTVLEEPDNAFDLILMDVEMSRVDGREATRRIRMAGAEVPVIGVTAHVLPEEHERSIAAGMQDQLTKPIMQDELVESVLACVGSRRA
jgi:signal transduction histidine kinase/CheY-like chemotaxis protein